METTGKTLQSDCSFGGVSPLMLPFPYPPLRVQEPNQFYANLLTVDYCGSVSELTAITQYIHGESCMCCEHCAQARTLLGIAIAEMMHLQKLGELIMLLGGHIDYSIPTRNGKSQLWTPGYIEFTGNLEGILAANIEAEKAAINQYEQHMKMIEDSCINAVLAKIVQDEEYHIMLLRMM